MPVHMGTITAHSGATALVPDTLQAHHSHSVETAIDPIAREKEMTSMSNVTVVVILAIVTMTFGAIIGVFLYRSAAPKFWGHLQVPTILWLTTILLLISSFTFEMARRQLLQGNQEGFHFMMSWTLTLAAAFVAGQILGWFQFLHTGVVLANNPHSWFIFLFSGIHAVHVVVGMIGVLYLFLRTREPASGPKFQMQTRVVAKAVSICWHYLGFLWIVMFALLVGWKR